jgi:GNAT superfamily N-acetyltransferase
VDVRLPRAADLAVAESVWIAATTARGRSPSTGRIRRVQAKLSAPDVACWSPFRGGTAVGMTLAEPGRSHDGAGPVVPGCGHVSMVFVRPEVWGGASGRLLLAALHADAARLGWNRLTVWTAAADEPARRLYAGHGYRLTGRE